MDITAGKLNGVFIITLAPLRDERGFFMRAYDKAMMTAAGLDREWVQENHSRSEKPGTLRGLHFQLSPYAETKLVRCIRGAMLDVWVDLRLDSPDFGRWESIELSESEPKMVFIPRGFAHGFCTLSPECEVLYKVDNPYRPDHEGGLLWNDSELGIDWPVETPFLSEKDRKNMTLRQFREQFRGIVL